jgi:hypothetical protein
MAAEQRYRQNPMPPTRKRHSGSDDGCLGACDDGPSRATFDPPVSNLLGFAAFGQAFGSSAPPAGSQELVSIPIPAILGRKTCDLSGDQAD